MRKTLLTVGAVAVALLLAGGLLGWYRRNIEWRSQATQALTTERVRFLQQESLFVARLDSVADTVTSLRKQIATAKVRTQRASGQLLQLRDSLSLASQTADSLDIALQVIDEQDSVIVAQQDEITQYEISDAIMSTGLLIAEARSDSQASRIADLEWLVQRAPLLQVSPKPRRTALIVAVTAVATLTLRSLIK